MNIRDILELLVNCENPHPAIPAGTKENVYFLIDNTRNVERKKNKKSAEFHDDCGAWERSGSSPKSYYTCVDLKNIFLRKGAYCRPRQVKGKMTYEPMVPQPDPDTIMEVHRYYTTLKGAPGYKRRITWIGSEADCLPLVACVEYTGTAPATTSPQHGNAKVNTAPYRRTNPRTMARIRETCTTAAPSKVYQELVDDDYDVRDTQQVKNVKHKVVNPGSESSGRRQNLADAMQKIDETLLHSHPLVQATVRNKLKSPGIILYTEEQLQDFRRSCCAGALNVSTEVGVDKTLNLGLVHLTVIAFKQPSVTRKMTGEHPVFLGPMYLHGNSDMFSLLLFFQHLHGKLLDAPGDPVFGSDDDKAPGKSHC